MADTLPKSFLKIFWNLDESLEIAYVVFCAVSLIILPMIIYQTRRKIETIKDPKINNSYCVISLNILNAMQVISIWTLVFNVVILIMYIVNPQIPNSQIWKNFYFDLGLIGK